MAKQASVESPLSLILYKVLITNTATHSPPIITLADNILAEKKQPSSAEVNQNSAKPDQVVMPLVSSQPQLLKVIIVPSERGGQ